MKMNVNAQHFNFKPFSLHLLPKLANMLQHSCYFSTMSALPHQEYFCSVIVSNILSVIILTIKYGNIQSAFTFQAEQKQIKMNIPVVPLLCILHMGSGAPISFSIPFPPTEEFLSRPTGRPFTITVEGNIGAGKSTLLNYFLKYPDMVILKEPLNIWQNLNGTNFLELVYKDQARWGMTFESLVTLTMMEGHLAGTHAKGVNPVKVMERSIHSARACFMEQLKPIMTEGEMAVLDGWYNMLTLRPEFDTDVDLIIYLRTSPEVAESRVMKRNRYEEEAIPFSYYQKMHQLHDDWLIHQNSTVSSRQSLPQVFLKNIEYGAIFFYL